MIGEQNARQVRFKPGPTVARFIRSRSRVKGIRGPIGSGKTTGALWAMMQEIYGQPPMHDGIRRARWLVVRNSYRELADTTIRSFWDWFPPDALGEWRAQDMIQKITGPDIDAEIIFRSLDRPDSIRKLLSLEISGAYVNEARELPLEVIQMIEGRLGRYPAIRSGGSGSKMLLMDTNPPDASHWWPEMFEREQPEGWEQFIQPSGLADNAENIANLPPNYYRDLIAGKSAEWVTVYVHGRYGFLASGKPVFPEFQTHIHARPAIEWNGQPVYVGLDFGLTPAAAIMQLPAGGGMQQIGEVTTTDTGAVRFAGELKRYLAEKFGGKVAKVWGDPAGDQRAQTDEISVFQVLRANGVPAIPAPPHDAMIRREALAGMMTRLTMTGDPAYTVSLRDCPVTVKGMSGFYCFRRVLVGGLEPRFQDQPEKNKYSHVCEAAEYVALGLGEGSQVITQSEGQANATGYRRRLATARRLAVI
jgi:hypothetical protein